MIINHNCCIKLVPLITFIYDARSQTSLSCTFLIENGRSGTSCLYLVANLPIKGGREYGLTFCGLDGVCWLSSCTPGLPEMQRNLPVVVGYSSHR